MSRSYPKILRNRKRRIERRLDPERRWSEQTAPMLSASNIHFEMAERGQAVNYAGIGAIHLMGQRLGLAEEIDGMRLTNPTYHFAAEFVEVGG